MTHPIGYYTGYDPKTQSPEVLHNLQERFGSQLQQMTYEQKIVFRAALADYIANKPVHQPSPHPEEITLIDCCIESAGVDWNIWVRIVGYKPVLARIRRINRKVRTLTTE